MDTATDVTFGPIRVDSHLEVPDWLRPRYRDIRFISRSQDLEFGPAGDVLYVVSDWLTWLSARKAGLHAIHLEAGMVERADEDAARHDFFLQADSWIFRDDEDMTLFRGVSLGRLFTRETSLLLLSWHQIGRALDWIGKRFEAETWTLRDVRTEFGLIDAATKRDLFSRAASNAAVRAIDDLDEPLADCRDFPMIGDYTVRLPALETTPKAQLREFLRRLYGVTVASISTVFSKLSGDRPAILIIPTGLMLKNILGAYDRGRRVAPMLIAEREPKRPGFLISAAKNRYRLAHLPASPLDAEDRENIEAMRSRLGSALQDLDGTPAGALGHYVRCTLLGDDLLERFALQVKRTERLLSRYRPSRIVVTDVMNPGTREYIELGHRLGIPVDYLAHGMRVTRSMHDVLTGDRVYPPRIARFLSWGEQGERYLADHGHPVAARRIGYPAVDHLQGSLPPMANAGRALVLPYSVDTEGFVNMSGFVYGSLLEVISTLRRCGYGDIRVKIHPGSRFNRGYYERVLSHLAEPVDIIHSESHLPDYLAWADIVIGPVVSSSTVEALASGRPYFAMLFEPTVIERRYVEGLDLVGSGDDLERALRAGQSQDTGSVLEQFCSRSSIPSASRAFWDAMEEPFFAAAS